MISNTSIILHIHTYRKYLRSIIKIMAKHLLQNTEMNSKILEVMEVGAAACDQVSQIVRVNYLTRKDLTVIETLFKARFV